MTKGKYGGKVATELIEYRPDVLEELMSPLRSGATVLLNVRDSRMPKKTRKYPTVLVLTPLSGLGLGPYGLLVALPPYGSELVDLRVDLKATTFVRVGLSFKMASALVDALRHVLWRKV